MTEFWSKIGRKECLRYPYSPQKNCIFPNEDDVYERDKSRLQASLKSFGHKCLRDDEILPTNSEERSMMLKMMRISESKMLAEDLDILLGTDEAAMTTASIIVGQEQLRAQGSFDDWKELRQLIFVHPLSQSKCSVFLVDLTNGAVEVFSVGECITEELQNVGNELISNYMKVFPDRRLSFKARLQIPSDFYADSLLMAFVLAIQLHHRCKYFDLDKGKMMEYQRKLNKPLQDLHDDHLGKFTFGSLHPMMKPYITGTINNPADKAKELPDMGWTVVDVLGDGNCGPYCLLVGLQNNGNETYTTSRDGKEKMQGVKDWQENVVRFRKDLHGRSEKLLERHFKMGEEPAWWTFIGSYTEEDRADLSASFFAPDEPESVYFTKKGKKKYQMYAFWGSLVFSSLFKMRVILIMRNTSVAQDGGESTNWTTTTFHVDRVLKNKDRITQVNGIQRIPDDDFTATPTVEIFYTTGYTIGKDKKKKPVDNHFQFLRRVFVDDVPVDSSPEPTHPKLLDVIKDVVKRKGVDDGSEVDDRSAPTQEKNRRDSTKTVEQAEGSLEPGNKVPTQQVDHEPVEESHRPTVEGVIEAGNREPTQQEEEIPTQQTEQRSKPSEPVEESQLLGENRPTVEGVQQEDETRNTTTSVEPVEESQQHAIGENSPTVEKSIKPSDKPQKFGDEMRDDLLHGDKAQSPKQTNEQVENSSSDDDASHSSSDDDASPPSSDDDARHSTTDKEIRPITRASNRTTTGTKEGAGGTKKGASKPQEKKQPAVKRPITLSGKEQAAAKRPKISRGKKQAPAKRPTTSRGKEQAAAKRPTTSRGKVMQQYGHEYFDSHYWAGTLKHGTPARMKYDPVGDTFWICFVHDKTLTQAREQKNVDDFDDLLVNEARKRPDEWVGCSIGDPGDVEAPKALRTSQKTVYRQHNQRFCLTYSLANALHYCEMSQEADILNSQARVFALKTFEDQLHSLREFLGSLVPRIGRPTIFNNKKLNKKKYYKPRTITWESLLSELVPHPTIVISVGSSGIPSHAFCIVDDLIFDSSFPCALKLKQESVDLIFNGDKVSIFLALRFNMKWSPKGVTTSEQYKREVKLNWDCPSRIFIKRTCLDWYMPHYIMKSDKMEE